jgi:hypothetical protein
MTEAYRNPHKTRQARQKHFAVLAPPRPANSFAQASPAIEIF